MKAKSIDESAELVLFIDKLQFAIAWVARKRKIEKQPKNNQI